MRKFEVVQDFAIQYDKKPVKMPVRATKHSAGYDIYSPIDVTIEPKSMIFSKKFNGQDILDIGTVVTYPVKTGDSYQTITHFY